MAITDPAELILYDIDLTTRLAIMPFESSNFYSVLSDMGSGMVKIPLDSRTAALVDYGKFVQINYRGGPRGGFFIDNIAKYTADDSEGGGRWMSLSGPGMLSYLQKAIVDDNGSLETTREFTALSKAAILILLLEEAQARGSIPALTWDFTATEDSNTDLWEDAEDDSVNVDTNLLELVRKFAGLGIDFDIRFEAGGLVLSAYKNSGLGSNISQDVVFRIGSNCEEVHYDERGDRVVNSYRVRFQSGSMTVEDGVSIGLYGRNEKGLNLRTAQSDASAATYAAALLEITKNPRKGISVRVYDGVGPRLFIDYKIGDTIMLDNKGETETFRILGVQADFDGKLYSNVVVEFNSLINELLADIDRRLEALLNEWNTAHDSNLLEVRRWVPLAHPADVIGTIYDVALNDRILWVAGTITNIGGLPTSDVAAYDMETGQWLNIVGTATGGIRALCVVDGVVYAGRTAILGSLLIHFTGSGWVTDADSSDFMSIFALATDGTNLYVGGSFIDLDGVTNASGVCRLDTTTGTIHAMGSGLAGIIYALAWDDVNDRLIIGGDIAGHDNICAWDGSTYSDFDIGLDGIVRAVAVRGSDVVAGGEFTDYVSVFNGVSWNTLPGLDDIVRGLDVRIADIYAVGDFTEGVMRNSAGVWYSLSGGLNGNAFSVLVDGNSTIVGGSAITQAGGVSVNDLCMYITTFDDLLDHISRSSNTFDMAAAIHAAPSVTSPTDASEIPLWNSVTELLGKITFANLWAWVKGKIESITLNLGGSTVNPFSGSNTLNQGASGASPAFFQTAFGSSFAPFYTWARARGTPGSETAILDGDVIGRLRARAHDGSGWSTTQAEIRVIADGDWTGSSHGTKVQIFVTPNGSTTLSAVPDVMVLSDGALVISNIKSGPDQATAGAIAGELWKTASHATLPDDVILIGV